MGIILAATIVAAVAASSASIAVICWRQGRYRSLFPTDCSKYEKTPFPNSNGEVVEVVVSVRGFAFPSVESKSGSIFLGLQLRSSVLGMIFDPALEISTLKFRDVQVFERGVRGVRYVNLTRLRQAGVVEGTYVRLHGQRLKWRPCRACLHFGTEQPQFDDRVLVVAPHPDDAEIAAFGLYESSGATIVTVTAGESTDRNPRFPRPLIGRLRVLDSVFAPRIAGIPSNLSINLCYPDGKLAKMQREPAEHFRDSDDLDPAQLRELTDSSLLAKYKDSSWCGLIADLVHLLRIVKPTIIVAPHPWLDAHADHVFTTAAICEALEKLDLARGRFYFYSNHNRYSELWPLGPSGAGVPLTPMCDDDLIECDGVYSHALTDVQLMTKLVALEAMHDIRDLSPPEPVRAIDRWKFIRRQLAAMLEGLGSPSTTSLRRAVRPDEVFLTTSYERGCALSKRVLERIQEKWT